MSWLRLAFAERAFWQRYKVGIGTSLTPPAEESVGSTALRYNPSETNDGGRWAAKLA